MKFVITFPQSFIFLCDSGCLIPVILSYSYELFLYVKSAINIYSTFLNFRSCLMTFKGLDLGLEILTSSALSNLLVTWSKLEMAN